MNDDDNNDDVTIFQGLPGNPGVPGERGLRGATGADVSE